MNKIDFGALGNELSAFIRGAIHHHTYVSEKEQTWLATIVVALRDAHTHRWIHIDDELPLIGQWVLVGGYHEVNGEVKEWNACALRKDRGSGSWLWDFDQDGMDGMGIEFWCVIRDLPACAPLQTKTQRSRSYGATMSDATREDRSGVCVRSVYEFKLTPDEFDGRQTIVRLATHIYSSPAFRAEPEPLHNLVAKLIAAIPHGETVEVVIGGMSLGYFDVDVAEVKVESRET